MSVFSPVIYHNESIYSQYYNGRRIFDLSILTPQAQKAVLGSIETEETHDRPCNNSLTALPIIVATPCKNRTLAASLP